MDYKDFPAKMTNEIICHGIDRLNQFSEFDCTSDIHFHLYNEDYFCIYYYEAEKFLGNEVFNVIEYIKNYENENFGSVNTDFSDPCKVANMFSYIIGEEILSECPIIDVKWNENLNSSDIEILKMELENLLRGEK